MPAAKAHGLEDSVGGLWMLTNALRYASAQSRLEHYTADFMAKH